MYKKRNGFGYYSPWLVVNKARMDTVLPACCMLYFSMEVKK